MYRSAVIEQEAYTVFPTNKILFPGPLPPDVLKHRAEDFKKEAKEPNNFFFKVVDTDLEGDEKMIASAKWHESQHAGGHQTLCKSTADN